MHLPQGFRYATVYARIRKTKKDDVALIVSDTPATAAAVFTTNRVKAAPVLLAQANLRKSKGKVSAILVNAGNANCATQTGDAVARETCAAVAEALGMPAEQILPASTGVIGVELNPALITKAVPKLKKALTKGTFMQVAQAILTTDLVYKVACAEVALNGGVVRIAGMTKGSGMIQPRMATTLGFIMTDAAVPAPLLKTLTSAANEASYNRISVDGDTSTNDTLAVLANGASGVKVTKEDEAIFGEALSRVAQDLAIQIARDGEGARKLITIQVSGAADDAAAATIARSIANSPLVKTAIAGSDANWGRIICAAGYAGVEFDPRKVDIALQGTVVCEKGLAANFNEPALKKALDSPECTIDFVIGGRGPGRARFWTCDLTEGYIRINGSYRT
ncbi:MAG: bifunctional glutamate N-acetyltransferase/amino-acid acetyltransferase ArgJ [Bryobacterales bacterium]|nr:bifunctional glutamate N-acetyltransferase/amino-acid acetyltransferase ArgJ [Bryobacterales bacterium]